MQNIAIDNSDLTKIIKTNSVYIDKTKFIYNIISSNTYYFLARPRRFGKSLTVDTLKQIYLGKKELFAGLYIDSTDWKWEVHPIIQLDFNKIPNANSQMLSNAVSFQLRTTATHYEVALEQELPSMQFAELITKLSKKYQKGVVILVDEYDKPIISHLGEGEEELQIAKENQKFMKVFYDNLKALGEHLQTVFITGVSKFSRVSIFSTLNNLIELDSHPQFADFLGYTTEELHHNFDNHFIAMSEKLNITKDELYELFRTYYNGFRFSEEEIKVYNPFSVGRALSFKQLKNYWFESGTPTFLINLIKEKNYNLTGLENMKIAVDEIKAYDIGSLAIEPLLFQTGYLTIKSVADFGRVLTLTYPNLEVEEGFNNQLLKMASQDKVKSVLIFELKKHLLAENYDDFFDLIKSIFASVAYNIIPKNDGIIDPFIKLTKFELYYHSLFYLITSLMADIYLKVSSELLTNVGRLDMALETPDKMFILEFKLDQSANAAIEQIKTRKYADRFVSSGKKIILIGIDFSSEEKNIREFLIV